MKKKIEEFINRAAFEGGNDVILSYFVDEIMELFASQKAEILDEVIKKLEKMTREVALPVFPIGGETDFGHPREVEGYNDALNSVIKLLTDMRNTK